MKSAQIFGTDLTTSRLSFGTASLHHLFRSNQRQTLLAAAVNAGFTHFDTSPYYGYGLAEKELGQLLRNCPSEVTVASKVGLYPPIGSSANSAQVVARKAIGRVLPKASMPIQDWSLERANSSLEKTLRRIRRDYLDILYLHEPIYGCLDESDFVEWLENQKKLGKVRHWGLAGNSARFGKWLEPGHLLAQILQVRRTLDDVGVAPGLSARPNQFSYGYLSSAKSELGEADVPKILNKVLRMNPEGSIIVSTRNVSRVAQLAKAAL
jgi:aryl-alcohol dehydrogenase-like predicted oxidoreductase